MSLPQRRRYKRSTSLEHGLLVSGDKNYDMLYSQDDKNMLHGICTNIVKELIFISKLLQYSTNDVQHAHELEQLGIRLHKNVTKIDKVLEEYAEGTEYKATQKTA